MKAKEIKWGSWEGCDNFKYCRGLVGQFIAYTLYEAVDHYWVADEIGDDSMSISFTEFQSIEAAKDGCEDNLAKYVEWLNKQLQWLGESE